MPIGAIVGAVEPGVGRNQESEDSVRLEEPLQSAERADVVPQVLEHVDGHHRVEALALELGQGLGREVGDVGQREAALRPPRAAPGGKGDQVRLAVDAVDELGSLEELDDPPEAAPDLQDALAEMGEELIELPAEIGTVDLVESPVALQSTSLAVRRNRETS